VQEEYTALLRDSVRLRFRADVPVGINLSGGLDSSTLLGLVQAVQGPESEVKAFTFVTGDPEYDELPWVRQMLEHTRHPSVVCRLDPSDVPALAESVQAYQDEPFGGLPTLAYARLFEEARAQGVIVLLDGQGLDEQWGGYDYYTAALAPRSTQHSGYPPQRVARRLRVPAAAGGSQPQFVQGVTDSPVRPDCLTPDFRSLARPFSPPMPFGDALRNLQYRDAMHTKIPRALRFNDRVSMRASTELREPFLDHRLFELALCQPQGRKIVGSTSKWLLRRIARGLMPSKITEAQKRPLQTPQREWLRGPLNGWASDLIEEVLSAYGGEWFDKDMVRTTWGSYREGLGNNSFYVWQWLSLQLLAEPMSLKQVPA
jgi:asparagine synthase (glutamine-hydrolysing)